MAVNPYSSHEHKAKDSTSPFSRSRRSTLRQSRLVNRSLAGLGINVMSLNTIIAVGIEK